MYPRSSNYNYNESPASPPRHYQHHHHAAPPPDFYEDTSSEIYVDSTYPPHHNPGPPPPPPPRISRIPQQQGASHQQQNHGGSNNNTRPTTPMYSTRPHTTTPSEYSSVSKSKNKNKGGVVIETMSAPNPCCPDSKGVCCILLLVNLGLLLVTLGFSIVLQLFEPPFVWYCGLLFLIVGFIALIVSLLFCMRICRYSRWSSSSYRSNSSLHGNNQEPSELYWTHHWQKRINLPGTTSRSSQNVDDTVFHTQGHPGNHHRGMSTSS